MLSAACFNMLTHVTFYELELIFTGVSGNHVQLISKH